MAVASQRFIEAWAVVERAHRRPLTRLSQRLGFAFYPLLAVAMLAGLAWDWQGARTLDAAEDAVFDRIIGWRPLEPRPSGRTVVVEIDDCSIDWFRARGEGGWPWSRERHADLLDALDRAGVRAVGVDILLADGAPADPGGDALLEAMAAAGDGRFLFAASRLHPDFDAAARTRAAEVPGAFRLDPAAAAPGPAVAVLQPYGAAMARHSGLANVQRGGDGLLRDVPLYQATGGWALPSLALRLAEAAGAGTSAAVAARGGLLRVNWRQRSTLPYASAADVLEGRPVCGGAPPALHGAVVVVGHTAAGINDAKPTPVDMAMPGVEVLAEAVEALLTDGWIRMPPAWLKYVLAAALVLLSGWVFWRGEPHADVDAFFAAVNVALVAVAFAGLTFFGTFVDIFASLGYGVLCFGLCRGYATVQRGRATGNTDYRLAHDPASQPWLLLACLRFEAGPSLPPRAAARARREYRRILRRWLHASTDAVMIEGVVERKHWLQAILDDELLLAWGAAGEDEVRDEARRGLQALHAALAASGERPHERGLATVCSATALLDDGGGDRAAQRRRLRALLGQDFDRLPRRPLGASDAIPHSTPPLPRDLPCDPPPDC